MRRRLTGWPARLAPHLLFLVPELLTAAGPFVDRLIARAGGRPRFRMPDFFYGGQALIEGVMMRGRTTVAMSVRPPSGEIVTCREPLPAALQRGRWSKVPSLRGVFVLYETLVHRHADADALGGASPPRARTSRSARDDGGDDGRSRIGFAVGALLPPAALPLDLRGATPRRSDLLANLVEGADPAGGLHRLHRG